MNRSANPYTSTESAPQAATSLPSQLLVTKFYIPVAPGVLIGRPRLSTLLDRSLEHPFTLVSAPAGFGKTTVLSTWARSLQADQALVAWLSLDEEDNDPQTFWTYILSALDAQQPHHFTSLLESLQSPHPLSAKSLLATLINRLAESTHRFVLILDDYQLIMQEQIHSSLAYLIEYLPAQLRIIVSTRADPLLPLPQLRACKQVLEVRMNQLRCTREETSAFFQEVMGIQLSEKIIQDITARTEGWLVGLHLLGLSLPAQANPLALLEEVSGSHRYILDYLTEVVLRRQPQEVQTFLLSTCILEQMTASLCDVVIQQGGSQYLLEGLEHANLFVVALDSRRQWYRYHALFAEALHYQLEQTHADQLLGLHYRASLWYAEHEQTTQAILHAFKAHEWQWAADLIERKSYQLMALSWGASQHQLNVFQEWLKQLPVEVIASRPRLCLACAYMLSLVASYPMLNGWLDAADARLTTLLGIQTSEEVSQPVLDFQARQEQQDLLGQMISWRAFLRSTWEDYGQAALSLCQQALTLLSAENALTRAQVGFTQLMAYYVSSANDATTAIECGLHGASEARAAGLSSLAVVSMGATSYFMKGAGRLHEAYQLTQRAIQLGKKPNEPLLPDVGLPLVWQAEILREWNQLDTACALVQEGIALCQQTSGCISLGYVIFGYAVLLRIFLSYGDLEQARSTFRGFERISKCVNQPLDLHFRSLYTTGDQIRLWLACGERDKAISWVEKLDLEELHGTPFAHEREEVARVRVLLATDQSSSALDRLEFVLQRATAGKRWDHVIEVQLLQALAYQMCQQETQALDVLSEAVRLAEPEGYIRSFVDEGASIEALLYRLRKRDRKHGPTPYLDTLLAAFQQENKAHVSAGERTEAQPLAEPLSERERQVLQLLEQGASNLEIAQELVIAVDTVKRHVSHIFSKLGVNNRVQAVKQAQELGLLREKP